MSFNELDFIAVMSGLLRRPIVLIEGYLDYKYGQSEVSDFMCVDGKER